MSTAEFTMYATRYCSYCIRARELLEARGLIYREIRVDLELDQREVMAELAGRSSVPQIFLGDHHIGGYDELAAAERSGELDAWLEASRKPD